MHSARVICHFSAITFDGAGAGNNSGPRPGAGATPPRRAAPGNGLNGALRKRAGRHSRRIGMRVGGRALSDWERRYVSECGRVCARPRWSQSALALGSRPRPLAHPLRRELDCAPWAASLAAVVHVDARPHTRAIAIAAAAFVNGNHARCSQLRFHLCANSDADSASSALLSSFFWPPLDYII